MVCVEEGLDTMAVPLTWLAARVTLEEGAAVTRTSAKVRGSVSLREGTVPCCKLFDWSSMDVAEVSPTR